MVLPTTCVYVTDTSESRVDVVTNALFLLQLLSLCNGNERSGGCVDRQVEVQGQLYESEHVCPYNETLGDNTAADIH